MGGFNVNVDAFSLNYGIVGLVAIARDHLGEGFFQVTQGRMKWAWESLRLRLQCYTLWS